MNIIQLLDVWGTQFKGPSWRPWRSVLQAQHGLPIEDPDLVLRVTGRKTLPKGPYKRGTRIIGRRGGKSAMAAVEVIHAAVCRTYRLSPGEVGRVLIIAPSRSQARVVLQYVSGLLRAAPSLSDLIVDEATEWIKLANGISIEIATASFRHVRGYTVVAAVVDETAFLRDELSASPDVELFAALEPAMATIPNSLLLSISSPHGQAGQVFEEHRDNFGNEDAEILVVQADSRTMNPDLPQSVIDAAYRRDQEKARAEYGAEFRGLSSGLFSLEVLTARTLKDVTEIPPQYARGATAFGDMASGSGSDSATLAIAFSQIFDEGRSMVLAACREWKPPFNPSRVASEAAALVRTYGCRRLVLDRWAGGWTDAEFRRHGIEVARATQDKSALLLGFLEAMNSEQVLLLDNERIRSQALGLVRRITKATGKEIVEHGRAGDDLINAVAGALVAGAEESRAGDGIRLRRFQ